MIEDSWSRDVLHFMMFCPNEEPEVWRDIASIRIENSTIVYRTYL